VYFIIVIHYKEFC